MRAAIAGLSWSEPGPEAVQTQTQARALGARGVTVTRGGRALLRDLSLSVHPGEVLVLLGANGAGKSTLLRCLADEIRPQRGTVMLNGRPTTAWSARERAQRRAVLPQSSPLSFPFRALEVAAMGRIAHGGPSAADLSIAAEALEAAEVGHLAQRAYTTLSGGERQRVHLARILTQVWHPLPRHEPRYLLLDEPTASLDLTHQHGVLTLVRGLTRQDVGVLVVLHDLNLAAQYGDRIAVLREGSLLACGDVDAVLRGEVIEAGFGLSVRVLPHPELDCPLIVARGVGVVGTQRAST